jgi:putative heme-binding domain-containing protein
MDRYNSARSARSPPDDFHPAARGVVLTGLQDEARSRKSIKEEGKPIMRASLALALIATVLPMETRAAEKPARALPAVADGWSIELAAEAPQILYPTAIVSAPDGTLYLGSDPMDMLGPPTTPIDRVLAIKDGRVTTFADKLWSVMGLEWIDGTLYVVHAPFLSAFRDTNGDGKADHRIDLITGLGPKVPGFNGLNDHIASGIRLGMDGFLYIAVGDKGIPSGVALDGSTIPLFGGGVIRIRPDGTSLEVVSTGECNPLSVALSATDEIFTYGNDDDSKKWPNSLTHHIVGGHYGYPYQFLTTPRRALPIMAGRIGGSGAQGVCYNEDGLPEEYRGNLFFCDWGLQTVFRHEIRKAGGTFAVVRCTAFLTKGGVPDFRPFSMAVASDGAGFWLVDWAYDGWLAPGPKTGRLYRLRHRGARPIEPASRPSGQSPTARLKALDHPALTVRLESQRVLARMGSMAVPLLIERLKRREPETGRLHALWALDAIGGTEARRAIASVLVDAAAPVRIQAARSAGIRRDPAAFPELVRLLRDRDAAVRREAAIALGRLGTAKAAPALYAALDEADTFAAWSVRQAIRRLNAWDKDALVAALLDERRLEAALRLTDEAWAVPVVEALTDSLRQTQPVPVPVRSRLIANLAGLYRRYPEWSGSWFGTNPLAGRLPEKTQDWSPDGMKGVLKGLALGLADRDSSVRSQAIVGLSQAGPVAAPLLRSALIKEREPRNQAILAETLGTLRDAASSPILAVLVADAQRTEAVRAAALDALSQFRDPPSLRARFRLIYDSQAPASLVARALPELARAGFLPPNDLASFLESPAAAVRAAALLSLNVKRALPVDLKPAVLDRLDDPAAEVREAAILAVAALSLREAVPRLLAAAGDPKFPARATAISALCQMPDPRAVTVYLTAIQDRDPRMRRAGESALLAIRDRVGDQLASAAQSAPFSEPAVALTLDRVRAYFQPICGWKVIGPFPRATPQVFIGESAIDFARAHTGVLGQSIRWTPRQADPATGRVDLDDLKHTSGDHGFGYDTSSSPDLCAFGYAEIDSPSGGPALMLLGSSGTMIVTVNQKPVYQYTDAAGRAFAAGTDLVRLNLAKGRNRILVVSRQGIGRWSFAIQAAMSPSHSGSARPAPVTVEELRRFALHHEGDPQRGEEIFFDPKGIGCARCHSAGGRGTAAVGPDLTGLASTYDRAELIRSVLEPSQRIATGYQPVSVATRDGKVITGVVCAETDDLLQVADSEAKITQIPKRDITVRRVSEVSVMPPQSVESLSPVEFSDLISYLSSLRKAPPQGSDPPKPRP